MMKKILVVDDDPGVRYTVKSGLETVDDTYKVISIDSGFECLKYLKNNDTPDIILLDVMMPGMSGWETFDKIRDNTEWKKIPIVFLTARTDEIAKNALLIFFPEPSTCIHFLLDGLWNKGGCNYLAVSVGE